MKNAGHDIDRYVRISTTDLKKSIFRNISGRNGVLKNQVAMAHKTQKELGVQPSMDVNVTTATFWGYYWHNSEKYVRLTFRIGVIGFALTVLTSAISLIKDIIALL